jgi:hypothetical protein
MPPQPVSGYYLLRNPLSPTHNKQVELHHISHAGELETQPQLENRVMAMHDKSIDLFMVEKERQYLAYKKQLTLTSYRKEPHRD